MTADIKVVGHVVTDDPQGDHEVGFPWPSSPAWVQRARDHAEGRLVRVRLTPDGDRILHQLTRAHLERLPELVRERTVVRSR